MADFTLGDYGTPQVPNALDNMLKMGQVQKYNLDVAKDARNFNALRQYGDAAARGDPEAKIRLKAEFPEAAETHQRIEHGTALTVEQKQQTQSTAVARLAAELGNIVDPTARMAAANQRMTQWERQGVIHPDTIDYYREQFARNPRALDAMIHQNLKPEDLPGVIGQKQRILESFKPPVTADLPADNPFGHKPYNVPPPSLPGAYGSGTGGALPPVYPGLPPVTGGGVAPRTGPDYRPGVINREPLGPPSVKPMSYNEPSGAGGAEGTPYETPTSGTAAASTRSRVPEGAIGPGPVAQMIKSETAKHDNLNDELTQVTADIESGHGTQPDRPGSQYRGVFQLGNAERARWGGSGIPQGLQSLSNRKRELTQILGREPENWEVYMAHQQGSTGASRLINNPNMRAGELTNPSYISANGGDPNAPASQFVDKWRQQYEGKAGRYRGAPVAAAPGEPAAPTVRAAAATPAAPGAATAAEAPAATPEAVAAAPAAAARPSAPGAPPRPATQFGLYVGDSITAQQIRHGGTGTEDAPNKGQPIEPGLTAGIGDSPKRVLDRINTIDKVPETVFLSSGATNRPTEVGLVGDQIAALGEKGAKYVVVPGVGPGVKNADMINELLRDAVEEPREGVKGVFFEPQVKWISNKSESGIHPAQVDKVREQALQALQRAQASSTLTDAERNTTQQPPVLGPEAQADTVVYPDRGNVPAVQPVAAGELQPPDVLVGEKTPSLTTAAADQSLIPQGAYPAPQPEIVEQAKVRQTEINAEFKDITKDAKGAEAGLASLKKLEAVLTGGLVTGVSAKQRQFINTAISEFANYIGTANKMSDRVTALYNMFDSVSRQLGFDMVVSLGSREAQQIVAQVMDIKPSILHSVAGNRAIIESLRQVFQMQIDMKNFYQGRIMKPETYYGKLGMREDFFKENPPEVYASKAIPLQLPKDASGRLLRDQMVPGVYYDATGAQGYESGDRVLFDGNKLTHAGKPSYLQPSGKR